MSGVMTLVSTFSTLVGTILVMSSLFMFYREASVTSGLMYGCQGSAMTRDVRLSYLGLLTLRQTPACAKQWSIEDCAGYAAVAAPGVATYLKDLETNYHCSGFCYASRPANASLAEAPPGT